MRIVTRPDFDGVVCAALLYEAEKVEQPVKWVQPNDMQKGLVNVKQGDIIANLPYDSRGSLWFDHHYTNKIDTPFTGGFKIAPSAAGIVYEYYKNRFSRDFSDLVKETDKIDSADLAMDEVLYPEKYPYLILSMTIYGHDDREETYWNMLVDLLRKYPVQRILKNKKVKKRCETVTEQNKQYKLLLKKHTSLKNHVSITDFRTLDKAPEGNRFLIYSLFPQSVVSVKIRYDDKDKNRLAVSVGHSIFNRNCNVNVGLMLSKFGGGGHRAAGSCRFDSDKADDYIPKILNILYQNESNDPGVMENA